MAVEKVQVLFSVREWAIGVLESRLASEGQRIRGKLPRGSRHRRVIHLADDPVHEIAHGAVATHTAPLEAMFEVSAEGEGRLDDLVGALDGVVPRLQEWVDAEGSAVVAGREHTIVPGTEPFVLLYPLRRLERLSTQQFQDHWLHKHAEIARQVPDVQGYRQFHADPEKTKAAGDALGLGITDFDGVAEAYHSDLETFRKIMARPEVAGAALEDERKFIDHGRSLMIGLCRLAWDAPA